MATAAPLLQEFVECPICTEIFVEPQSLVCRHTLCRSCVDKLKDGSTVKCPICSSKSQVGAIQPDHQMLTMVDKYRQPNVLPQKSLPALTADQMCDVCEEGERAVVSCCAECQQYLCQLCQRWHARSKLSANHKVTNLSELARDIKEQVGQQQQLMQQKQSELQQLTKSAEAANNISKAEEQALEEIRQRRLDQMQHFDELEKQVNAEKKRAMTLLKEEEEKAKSSLADLEEQLKKLQDFIEGDDLSINVSHASVREEAEKCLKSAYVSVRPPRLCVTVGENHYTAVTVNVIEPCNVTSSYENLMHKKYVCDKKVLLESGVRDITHIGNKLICTLRKCLVICSSNSLEILETIYFDNITWANCCTLTATGSYLVSCSDTGLNEVNAQGKTVSLILAMKCNSISQESDAYYTFANTCEVVCVCLNKQRSMWDVKRRIKISPIVRSGHITINTFRVYHGSLYISWHVKVSQDNAIIDTITKHSMLGQIIATYGINGENSNFPGQLYNAFLSSWDHSGNMLVCDYCNKKLKVCTPQGVWHEVAGVKPAIGPVSAAINNDTIYVGCDTAKEGGTSLLKYVIASKTRPLQYLKRLIKPRTSSSLK